MKKIGSVLALASGAAIAASSTAFASNLSLVTGASPFAACAAADAGQTGRNYLNAEVEPQLSVGANGTTLVGAQQQDRWSDGGSHGLSVGYSSNGGRTWHESSLPFDMCSPGAPPSLSFYQRASDPWVSIGPKDGIAYASGLAFNDVNNKNSVAVATSTDGGATWGNAQPIPGSVYTTFQFGTDKNSTTADPTRAGVAYTVWDTLIEPTDNPDDNPHAAAYSGPAYFSKTTDGGKTWSQAQIMVNTANRQQTIGNIIVVDPRDDALYDFTDLIVSPNTPFQGAHSNEQLAFVKSTDGGNTWSSPQVIAPFNELGVVNPNNPSQVLRVGDGLEEVAIDPASGQIYVVYESSTNYNKNVKQSAASWDNEILLTTTKDGGQTWTAPSVVHALASGLPTYTPTVAVGANGTVAVSYYDNRNLVSGSANMATDYWISFSTDHGQTFNDEKHIAGPFDQLTAPNARGYFLGDYEALQPIGSGFQAYFVKTNCNGTMTSSGVTFPSGGACAPASSTTTATSNTNPTDVFSTFVTR